MREVVSFSIKDSVQRINLYNAGVAMSSPLI